VALRLLSFDVLHHSKIVPFSVTARCVAIPVVHQLAAFIWDECLEATVVRRVGLMEVTRDFDYNCAFGVADRRMEWRTSITMDGA
jgi:hypothetical protein